MSNNSFSQEIKLLKLASIDALIPQESVTPLTDLIGQEFLPNDERLGNTTLQIKERDLVFFDEHIRIVVNLQIPRCNEELLKSCLSRLELRLEIWVEEQTQIKPLDTTAHVPSRDLIFSGQVSDVEDPIVLLSQSDTETTTDNILSLIWELESVLNRPRLRIPEPTVVLKVLAAFASSKPSDSHLREQLLTPFQAEEENVFEPMQLVRGLEENPPYLAASRLERLVPRLPPNEQILRLESFSKSKYKIVPPAIARMRYSKAQDYTVNSRTVASLDIEIIPYIEVIASIENIDVSMAIGKAECLMSDFLPMSCQSGDVLTFLYILQSTGTQPNTPIMPDSPSLGSYNSSIDVLSISIRFSIQLNDETTADIRMDWTTNVDLSQALNPTFGPPSQPIQRHNRPSSLPFGNGNTKTLSSKNIGLQAINPNNTEFQGVVISFRGPIVPAKLGKIFTWQVTVVNRSARAAKLAIIPLPRVQRPTSQAQYFAKRHAPRSSTASFRPSERRHTRDGQDIDIAQAVVDENVLYAMQHSNVMPLETDLMSMTAELRIGPLAPGQCHESEISMVAFETGVLRVDAIRVIDLLREAEEGTAAPGVILDIRDLPDIMVEK